MCYQEKVKKTSLSETSSHWNVFINNGVRLAALRGLLDLPVVASPLHRRNCQHRCPYRKQRQLDGALFTVNDRPSVSSTGISHHAELDIVDTEREPGRKLSTLTHGIHRLHTSM